MPRPKLTPCGAQRTIVQSLANDGMPQEQIARKIGLRSPKTLRKYYKRELDEGEFQLAFAVRRTRWEEATSAKHLRATTDWIEAAGWIRPKERPQQVSEKPKQAPPIHVVLVPADQWDCQRARPKVYTRLPWDPPRRPRIGRPVPQPGFGSPEQQLKMVQALAILQFSAEQIAPRVGISSIKKFRSRYGKVFDEARIDGTWGVLQALRKMATRGKNYTAAKYVEEHFIEPPKTAVIPAGPKPIVQYLSAEGLYNPENGNDTSEMADEPLSVGNQAEKVESVVPRSGGEAGLFYPPWATEEQINGYPKPGVEERNYETEAQDRAA